MSKLQRHSGHAPLRVGLTYDLRDAYLAAGYGQEETAEFDSLETVEAIEGVLHRRGYATDRIGSLRDLAARLVAGERWDLVFNFAEGLHGVAREAQVPALLDAYAIPYTFSDPLVLALTLHKGLTKRVVRDAGVPIPAFAVVENLGDVARIDLPFPLFAKPVAEGSGKGVDPASKVTSRRALQQTCQRLLQRFRQPVLVETYLPGREFTVGILGTGARAETVNVLEVVLNANAEADAYGYLNKKECHERVRYVLVDDAEAREAARVALAAWRALGCRDGGRVDLRSDAGGQPNFIEVNPLAGLHPTFSDLPIGCTQAGMDYDTLIGRIVASALERVARPAAAVAAE